MRKENIPRMDRKGKPFPNGEVMDRLSRFYRAKKEGDLPVAISPPVDLILKKDDEGIDPSPQHIKTPQKQCGNKSCEDYVTKADIDWILELSTNPPTNSDTIPAIVNALPPTFRTGQATDHPFHQEAEANLSERSAPTTKQELDRTARGSEGMTSRRTRDEERVNRERGRSHTTHVFLDSGCLTGSYIREDVAKKLTSTRSQIF
jgi:hypothetical protein